MTTARAAATLAPIAARRLQRTTAVGTSSRDHARIRGAVGVGWGGVAFLLGYAVLHLLHIVHADVRALAVLTPIPLFQAMIGATALAVGAAVVLASIAGKAPGLLVALPRALLVGMIVLFLVITIFP